MRPGRSALVARDDIVTGERLQGLCDVSIIPSHVHRFHTHVELFARDMVTFDEYTDLQPADLARISAARTLFVYSHELDGFAEHVWPRLDGGPYVLMSHNSDHGVDASRLEFVEQAGDRLQRWFAQNLEVAHPKLEPLPIGIANSMWKHGHLRTLHRAMARAGTRPKDELVFLHFNPATHAPRQAVWNTLRAAFPDMAAEPRKSRGYPSYLRELARHRLCVCPRGNGPDTHRLWECLYLGVTPIVERSAHVELLAERGLPLVIVDDWAQVTPDLLSGVVTAPRDPAWQHLLRLSHYAALVGQAAQEAAGTAAA
jgi:hypothetical protein